MASAKISRILRAITFSGVLLIAEFPTQPIQALAMNFSTASSICIHSPQSETLLAWAFADNYLACVTTGELDGGQGIYLQNSGGEFTKVVAGGGGCDVKCMTYYGVPASISNSLYDTLAKQLNSGTPAR